MACSSSGCPATIPAHPGANAVMSRAAQVLWKGFGRGTATAPAGRGAGPGERGGSASHVVTARFVRQAGCFVPGKGKPGTQPAPPPTQPGAGAAVVCQRSTPSAFPHLLLLLRSLLALPPARLPPIAAAHAAHAGAAAPARHLRPAKVRRAGHMPLPKTVCAEIAAWDGVGGTSPLCPAHPESAVCIYMFAHIPSPSFLLSLAIFFSCSVFLSLSASPPALREQTSRSH